MDEGEEEGNVESLMPNCFNMLLDVYNPGTTTLDLQHIRRLLAEETCAEFVDKGKTNKSDITHKQNDMFSHAFNNMTCLNSGENPSPKGKFSGKENVPVGDALKQKRAVTRREGTGRTTTHRPFKVDLKSFDSLANEHMPKDQRILQEIHAFWEAEENREAISHKIQEAARDSETCSRKAISGHIKSGRRARIRHDGTGRQTASRAFDVQLPQYIDSVTSSDAEKLEEEEEEMPASSCLFTDSENQRKNNPITDLNTSTPGLSIVEMSLMQTMQKELLVPLCSSADKPQREIVEDQETPIYDETKLTLPLQGSIGNVTVRVAPMTSPTPPANPLAAFCVGAKETVKDTGKRFLDFDQLLELSSDLNGNAIDTNTCIEQSDIGSVLPEKTSEFREVAICNDDPLDEALLGISSLEVEKRRSEVELDNYNASGTGGEDARTCTSNNSQMPTIRGHNLLSTFEQGTTLEVPFHKASNTFEIPLDKSLKTSKPKNRRNLVREKYKTRRNSLSGSGTRWNGGVRRSTRIKSRPLEYWRGEKFLYGRVHESLTTVIGIKYSSPLQCFQKRGCKPPAFKVKSFVSEEYADYVQFAAI